MAWLARTVRLAALLGALTVLAAAAAAQQVPVKSYVARALEYLQQGNDPVATAFVRQAIAENPEHAYAHWLLGYLLARARDREGAVEAWLRASELRPEWSVPREALRSALLEAPPRWLSPPAMEQMPGEVVPVEVRLAPEGDSTTRTAGCRTYTPPADAAGPRLQDPKYGWEFPFHTYTYLRAPDAPRWDRRFAVHYERAEDAALARRVAALLGQLHAVAEERLGPRGASAPAETHLWLCRRGTAGGEEWRGNLYLYETPHTRGAGEWVREVAHEFGHVTIPGTRHYTEPEPLGNGYLGERLLPLWLWDAGNERVWDGEVSLAEYVRTRVLPAAAVFLNAGPTANARSDRGRSGMDYTIGLVLALELAHETPLIDALLRREIGATADNLLAGYRDRLRGLRPLSFTVRGRAFVPARSEAHFEAGATVGRRLAYRLFLPAGEWEITLDGEGAAARVTIAGAPLRRGSGGAFRWRSATSGWQLLEITADGKLALRRLRLSAVKEQTTGLRRPVSGNTDS